MRFISLITLFALVGALFAQETPKHAVLIQGLATGQLKPENLTPEQKNQLLIDMSKQMVDLKYRLVMLERKMAGEDDPDVPTQEQIQQIQQMFENIKTDLSNLNVAAMRTKMKTLEEAVPDIVNNQVYAKVMRDATVIGRRAGELDVEQWYQGQTSYTENVATLVLFFESWCPHCQDEMPRFEKLYQQFLPEGLGMVGVTKLRNNNTMTATMGFIAEYGISFPVAKETGNISDRYKVEAVPAAVIVRDGVVIWRGYPDLVTENTLRQALTNNR